MQNSEPTDSFQLLDSGLYAPKPKGKTAVTLSGPYISQEVEGTLDETIRRIQTFLSDTEQEWWITTEPKFGEEIAIHRRFLEMLYGIAVTWVDLEELETAQKIREMEKQRAKAALSGIQPGRRNGRR